MWLCVCECVFQECSVWVRSRSSQVSVIFTKKKYSAFHSIKTTDPKSPNTKCNFFFHFLWFENFGRFGVRKKCGCFCRLGFVQWLTFADRFKCCEVFFYVVVVVITIKSRCNCFTEYCIIFLTLCLSLSSKGVLATVGLYWVG